LVFKRAVYTTATTINFPNYIISAGFSNVTNNSAAVFPGNTNTSSSIYFFGTVHSGKIRNTFSFGTSLNLDSPQTYQFNTTLLITRGAANHTLNDINIYLMGSNVNGKGTYFIINRQLCTNDSYPFLMMI
jgi:hypothetical protein